MALFQSGNPTLSEKIFRKSLDSAADGTMTVKGSVTKFGFLLFMVLAGAVYTWHLYYESQPTQVMTLLWVGLIGGLITALIISFKPNTAKYLAPLYGVLEGFVVGALSAIINDQLALKYPNIVMQAVALTFGVAIAMFLLYNFRIIRPTQKLKAVIISATIGIGVLYLVYWVLLMFGVSVPFMSWQDSSVLGIGINLFIIVIAALSLIMDFERLEVGEEMQAPKSMEWYGAFGLLVTMIWLYIQILKLLSRFGSSRG